MTKPSGDPVYPTPAYVRIPSFRSIEEESAFRDTHDVTNLVDEDLRLVVVGFGGGPAEDFTCFLDRKDVAGLNREAPVVGVDL